jgi:hypothetical protein
MRQHQKNIQNLKPNRLHGEEVNRNHAGGVIIEERSPVLRRRLSIAAPTTIISPDRADQVPDLRRYAGAAPLAPSHLPGPKQPNPLRCHATTVSGWTNTNAAFHPAHKRRKRWSTTAGRKSRPSTDPEQPICSSDLPPFGSTTAQHGNLVPEGEVLQPQFSKVQQMF